MTLTLRRARARLIASFVGALALALPVAASADWREPVGGASPINQLASKNATNTDLTTVGGVPYVVWNEDTTAGGGSSSTIRVARLSADGTAWEKVANVGTNPISRLSSTSSEFPSIAAVAGRPWVAWHEGITQSNSEIRVARLNAAGTGWEKVPDTLRPINHLRQDPGGLAQYPTLVSDGGTRPYVSFFESDPGSGSLFFGANQSPAKVYVMRLNEAGTGWDEVGGGHANPLENFDAAFPRLTLVDGVPWVTFFQVEIVNNAPVIGVRAARLGAGGTWEQVGERILSGGPNGTIENPEIATIGGRPHIAASARLSDMTNRIRVFRLDEAGTGWEGLGTASPTGAEASGASLAAIGDQPWVAWRQRAGDSTVGVARLTGSGWEQVGSLYNNNTTNNGDVRFGPALANVNGFPWYSFSEGDQQTQGGQGVQPCCNQVRVARLEPEFGDSSSQPTDDSATLLSSVTDYDMPFPVGFEYGPNGTFGSSSEASPQGDAALLFRVIGGLTPSTLYSFRPFATAGTPQPRVRGTESFFVTDPPSDQQTGGGGTGAQGQTGAPGPAGAPGAAFDPARLPLLMAIVNAPERVKRGRALSVRFITSQDGLAVLRITRRGRLVATRRLSVRAGRRVLRWSGRLNGRAAARGPYAATLLFRANSGARAADRARFRIVR